MLNLIFQYIRVIKIDMYQSGEEIQMKIKRFSSECSFMSSTRSQCICVAFAMKLCFHTESHYTLCLIIQPKLQCFA